MHNIVAVRVMDLFICWSDWALLVDCRTLVVPSGHLSLAGDDL